MPSADCYLYAPGTTNLVSGLVDISGAPLSNPFQASSIGKVQFGAPNGVYDLRMKRGVRDQTIRIQCADLLQALNETASFLGARSAAPTTRVDGTPLQLADRYLNTTDQIEYIYKSVGWVANNLDGQLLATSSGASLVGAVLQGGTAGTVQQAIAESGNILRQELSVSGASMSGYVDPVAPAYLKTVSDIINSDSVSVMRFIPREKQAALYARTSTEDFTANINEALAVMRNGGELTVPVLINTTGLEIATSKNLKITGYGWSTGFKNNSQSGAHDLWIRGDAADDRTYGLDISSISFEGNVNSGNGIQLDRLGWYDSGVREPSVANLDKIQVLNSGQNGIQVGKSSTEGAGNSTNITGSKIHGSGRTGVLGIGQTNLIYVGGSNIALCKRDGVELNQVASTNSVDHCLIADNTRYGVYAFRCEEPIITRNGFNRNMQGAVVLSGDPTGSIKYTEAALVFGNLFGDNGRNAPIGSKREIQLYATKGSNIIANYFYGTGQETMIYLSDYCEGIAMSGNHFKDLTTEVMLAIKSGAINTTYTFDDDVDESLTRNIISNKVMQHIHAAGTTLLQVRNALTDAAPRFILDANGGMSWGPGTSAIDVTLRRTVAGSLTSSGGLQATRLMMTDGIPLPNAATGYASLFVDSADGLFKIRFSSGVTKIITLNP